MFAKARVVVYALLALLAAALLSLAVLVLVIDPEDYRDEISRFVNSATGVELRLGGELSWRFYPVLGFGAGDVELALQSGRPSIAQIDELAIGVEVLPLLSKKIAIDSLNIVGARINLLVDEGGNSNWQMANNSAEAGGDSRAAVPNAVASSEDSVGEPEHERTELPELILSSLSIRDSQIIYRDVNAAATYTVDISRIALTDINFNTPFPLLMTLRVRDQAGLDMTADIASDVSARLAEERFSLNNFSLSSQLSGLVAKPASVDVEADIVIDLKQDNLELAIKRWQVANLAGELQLAVTQLSEQQTFRGTIATQSFDLKTLMDTLGMEAPKTANAQALRDVRFSSDISGSMQSMQLKPLTVAVDGAAVTGAIEVTDVATQAVKFDLKMNAFNLDHYLPPPNIEQASKSQKALSGERAAEEQLIPVTLLRDLTVAGVFVAKELVVKGVPLADLAVSISAAAGDIQFKKIDARLLQGSLTARAALDVTADVPEIDADIAFSAIEMSELLQPLLDKTLVSGRTTMKVNTKAAGNDVDTLIESAIGRINIEMLNTIVHGVNVNQVATEALDNKLASFSVLTENYKSQLPRALKSDTRINDMVANMELSNGHLITPNFTADTGEGNLSVKGDIDLLAQSFDYQFGVVLSALDNNKYLRNIRWPVHCKGGFDTPVSQWCRPDSKTINKALEYAAEVALRDKAAGKLGEKLGIEQADEAAVENELREKAKEEEQRAKRKLQEKLNEKLNKLFD